MNVLQLIERSSDTFIDAFPRKQVKMPKQTNNPNSELLQCWPKSTPSKGVFNPNPKPKVQCQICKKYFSRKYHLERHVATVHNEKQFSCVCGKRFSRQDSWEIHSAKCNTGKMKLGSSLV